MLTDTRLRSAKPSDRTQRLSDGGGRPGSREVWKSHRGASWAGDRYLADGKTATEVLRWDTTCRTNEAT